MKRTLIITIETTGENAYRTMEAAEEEMLEHCDNVANSYRGCSVNAEICVEPLSDALISDLCNTGRPTIRDALARAWSHVARTLEIAEGDWDPPEDLESIRDDLKVIGAAQKLLVPPKLDTYLCSYFLPFDQAMLYFKCEAEDAAHAMEQLTNAEPAATSPHCEIYARAEGQR